MPVQILIKSRVVLERDERDQIQLPNMSLAPSGTLGNPPHIVRVQVQASGEPANFAERIQKAYPEKSFESRGPIRLGDERSPYTNPPVLQWPGELPERVNLRLLIRVQYYDSDASSMPMKENLKEATAECFLTMPPNPAPQATPPVKEVPVDSEKPQYSAQQALPTPSISSAGSSSTSTGSGSESGSTVDSSRSGSTEKSSEQEISSRTTTWSPRPELSAPRSSSPTQTESRLSTPNYIAEEVDPELLHPGWLAIDFGTANSTVTLFDPRSFPSQRALSAEQEDRLRVYLLNTLEGSNPAVSSEYETGWKGFVAEVNGDLSADAASAAGAGSKPNNASGEGALSTALNREGAAGLYRVMRAMDLALSRITDPDLHLAIATWITNTYHEAFKTPPLSVLRLFPVELDLDLHRFEIPSELEVKTTEPPLETLMGDHARQHRLADLASAGDTASFDWEAFRGHFHHSPKRYWGQETTLDVSADGKKRSVRVENLIQAAWKHLLDLTERYRGHEYHSRELTKGSINRAVVTYPTVAPPPIRVQARKLVKQLGIQHVGVMFDEAVSAAMFYLMREFGGTLDTGVEAFRARCRHGADGKLWQNVLVFDIGGGTTDIALIRLTLEEIDPFDPDEDRGGGGRYYKITPTLLGSSGHLQLGGELATLRVFLTLKALITDRILTLVSQKKLKSATFEDCLNRLSRKFQENGAYKSGSLVNAVDLPVGADLAKMDSEALTAMELVLPTRWRDAAKRLQTFYSLWEHAERAKISLSGSTVNDNGGARFDLSGHEVEALVRQTGISFTLSDLDALGITMDSEKFVRAIQPVIQEAVAIAKGLVESRLGEKTAGIDSEVYQWDRPTNSSSDGSKTEQQFEKLNWMILSGKTCNLDLVTQELQRSFSHSRYFHWNPDRVTFTPEYAKLATSLGACYAERLQQFRFAPASSKPHLRTGNNQVFIDVKNLFFFLPCSFHRECQTTYRTEKIFSAGSRFWRLDSQAVGKLRSLWLPVQLSMVIFRHDFDGGAQTIWGSYDGEALAKRLGMSPERFIEEIKVQFQVDHELRFKLFLTRGEPDSRAPAHYTISSPEDPSTPSISVKEALANGVTAGDDTLLSDADQPELKWEIAVTTHGRDTAPSKDREPNIVLESGSRLGRIFHYDGSSDTQVRGVISYPIPNLNQGKEYGFFARRPGTDQWIRLGMLHPAEDNGEYPLEYRVSLDQNGILRLHAGEVPYWTTESESGLKTPGRVFTTSLVMQPIKVEAQRDPFSGIH